VQEVKSVEIPLPSAFSTRRHNIILLSVGLAIALSVAIFMRMHDSVPEVAETVTTTTTTVQPLELPNVTADATGQLPGLELPASAPQPVVGAVPLPAPQQAVRAAPVQAAPQPAPAPVQQQPVIAKAAPAAPAATAGSALVSEQPKVNGSEHALRLEFDEDAWVEVRDGNDNILVAKMHRAGSLVRVTGKTPLSVTIGNAHAVRLFDNGKNIKLERYITADVAHVKLK